jgi:ADP-ribose pyrophosphatase YjhB (NUDIX family)
VSDLLCAIHQPNFFPRLSTLAKLFTADIWVVLDDVQFARRDYQHRCRATGPDGTERWLTVPVHLPAGRATLIRDVIVADPGQASRRAGDIIRRDYQASPFWPDVCGRTEEDESLGDALVREMREETGLLTEPGRLLYVCDHLPGGGAHVVHITFEVRRIGGTLGAVTDGLDTRPICGVRFVPLADLPSLGFGERFAALAMSGFPGAGSYMGPKSSIGL